jgi:GntR family phosphonate transport system transcriptional regulator
LLRAERGSGTYVETKRLAYPLRSRTRFSDIVGAGGHEPRGTLIEAQNETGTPEICSRLDLARGTTVIRIDAVRLADRTPICIGSSWLPQERFPDATKIYRRHGSLTRVLAAHGVTDYRRATTRVTASLADAFDATHLDISIGAPVLVVDSVDTDLKGRPVLACATRFAAERVEFVIETR